MSYKNDRDMSTEEIVDALEKVSETVKGPIADLQAQMLDIQQKVCRRGSGEPGDTGQTIDAITKAISSNAGVLALASGATKNTATVQVGGLGFLKKAAISNVTFPAPFQRLDVGFGNDPRRKLRLIDVLQHVPMETGAIQYIRLGNYSNAANYQIAQGDLKAEATVPTVLITAEAATIAHFLPTSSQVLADVPTLEQQLRGLLLFGLNDKLENQLINGPGTAGTIAGLSLAASTYTPTATAPADRLGEASAELATRGWIPSVAILNPKDWFHISSERGTTGEYTAGGWNMPSNPNVWNLDLVISSSMAQGSAIILDSQQVAILDRQQGIVDIGFINDQFARNELTIRAELRAQLAVYSPSAILKVALV